MTSGGRDDGLPGGAADAHDDLRRLTEPDDDVVYLDHNATTPVDPVVVEAMLPFLTTHFGNPSSDHALGRRARHAVETARAQVAAVLGAQPDEVVLTAGGTEANNLAVLGATAGRGGPGSGRHRVVTSAVEHPATQAPCARLGRAGWDVTVVGVGVQGAVAAEEVSAAMGPDVALATLMLAQNETGALMPVAEVAGAAHDAGVLVHTDAAQAVGKVPVDVDALGVDLLSIAGHKLYAPKGIGALYVRRGTGVEPVVVGAGQERGIRPGTENVAAAVGLGAACALAADRVVEEGVRLAALRDELWQTLRGRVPGLVRHTPEAALPNTLTVSFPGVRGADVLAAAPGLAASTGSACHAGQESPSEVLLAMGVPPEVAMGCVRLSLGHATTAHDVARAATMLVTAAAGVTASV